MLENERKREKKKSSQLSRVVCVVPRHYEVVPRRRALPFAVAAAGLRKNRVFFRDEHTVMVKNEEIGSSEARCVLQQRLSQAPRLDVARHLFFLGRESSFTVEKVWSRFFAFRWQRHAFFKRRGGEQTKT